MLSQNKIVHEKMPYAFTTTENHIPAHNTLHIARTASTAHILPAPALAPFAHLPAKACVCRIHQSQNKIQVAYHGLHTPVVHRPQCAPPYCALMGRPANLFAYTAFMPRSLPCPQWGRGPAAPDGQQPLLHCQQNFLQEGRLRTMLGTNGPHIGGWQAEYNEAGALFGKTCNILGSGKKNHEK